MGGLIINEGRIAADVHDGHSDRDSLGPSPDKTTKGIIDSVGTEHLLECYRIRPVNVSYLYIFRPQLIMSVIKDNSQVSLFETLYYCRYLVNLHSEEEALKSLR